MAICLIQDYYSWQKMESYLKIETSTAMHLLHLWKNDQGSMESKRGTAANTKGSYTTGRMYRHQPVGVNHTWICGATKGQHFNKGQVCCAMYYAMDVHNTIPSKGKKDKYPCNNSIILAAQQMF